MKQLSFFILISILLLSSCNNNNEPDLTIELPINLVYIPASIEINKADLDEQELKNIMNLVNNKHIINDISEIPDDPIGQNEAFYHINYNEQTLLIMYIFKKWSLDSYYNVFYKDTKENSFNWVVKLGTTTDLDDETEVVKLTRFAILVRKLPENANLKTWHSLTHLNN